MALLTYLNSFVDAGLWPTKCRGRADVRTYNNGICMGNNEPTRFTWRSKGYWRPHMSNTNISAWYDILTWWGETSIENGSGRCTQRQSGICLVNQQWHIQTRHDGTLTYALQLGKCPSGNDALDNSNHLSYLCSVLIVQCSFNFSLNHFSCSV